VAAAVAPRRNKAHSSRRNGRVSKVWKPRPFVFPSLGKYNGFLSKVWKLRAALTLARLFTRFRASFWARERPAAIVEARELHVSEVKIRKGESVDKALRRLKKKMDKEGVMREIRAHRHFEKPSEKKRRKAARARIRSV
jgi:small subunit ribosomal protein S21